MIRYSADSVKCDYDSYTDVLYVSFRSAPRVICDETPQGYVLRRVRSTGEVVGVTVLDYASRFAPDVTSIEVDAPEPFIVELPSLGCGNLAFG